MLNRLNDDRVLFVRVNGSDGPEAFEEEKNIKTLGELMAEENVDTKGETVTILEEYIELQRSLRGKFIFDKPTIPKYVAEFIESFDRTDSILLDLELVELADNSTEALTWQSNNPKEFSIAWLFGYDVEEEPVYVVESDIIGRGITTIALENRIKRDGFVKIVVIEDFVDRTDKKYHLSEEQIKEFAPMFWDSRIKIN